MSVEQARVSVVAAVLRQGGSAPSEDGEFVLSHVDGIEAMGFAGRFKLPHYLKRQWSFSPG